MAINRDERVVVDVFFGLIKSAGFDSGNLTLLSFFAEYFCSGLGQPI